MKTRLILILLILAAACAPPEQPAAETGTGAGTATPATGEILVGEYGSLTGSEATFGQSAHAGIALAVAEINAAGGVHGRKIRVVTEDDQSKAEEAANAVSKLISGNDVVAILGEAASSNSLAAAPICQRSGVPMISPSSTNPAVTLVGDYIFRVCFIDPYQGLVVARFAARDLGAKTAAILTDVRSDYSRGLTDTFRKAFTEAGGKVVAEQSYSKGDSDFRAQLTAIGKAGPDVVFVPGYYNDVAPIAIQSRDLGIKVPLLGADGWDSPKLLEIGGRSLEGSMFSNGYHADDPSPAVRQFVSKYEKKFGALPDGVAALAYDAMNVLADAIRRAGPGFDRKKVRDALAATRGFQAVTGDITFDENRNPVGKRAVIIEVRGGKLVLKKAIDP